MGITSEPYLPHFPRPFMLTCMLRTVQGLSWKAQRDTYLRGSPVILINGLAEQGESWYRNREVWQRDFELHTPGVLVYDGPVIQQRMQRGEPITVDFLTQRLAGFLDDYVQAPPYHLVASSLGGQIAVEYASRNPGKVDRMVLLCPSGMGSEERLPITEGARHKDYRGLVESTFFDANLASPGIIRYYAEKFKSKAWRRAIFETVRGTKSHSVRAKLSLIDRPVLVICGREDRIVDTHVVQAAVERLPNYQFVTISECGHAAQLEQPHIVNRLITKFLKGDDSPTANDPADTEADAFLPADLR
jgi:pimeloyl-ACP methyl ester carboxylesterase